MVAEEGLDGLAIPDVAADEREPRVRKDVGEAGQVPRVGESIEDNDPSRGGREQKAYEVRTDESGAARDEDGLHQALTSSGRPVYRAAGPAAPPAAAW
jgi:hypothetical protein